MKLATACLACAALALSGSLSAGKAMDVCRDANGNAYFTDRGCPEDTESQGRDYVPDAQTYGGRKSVDTRSPNGHDRSQGTGRRWQWRQEPASR